jgi:hypothetical protein
MMTTSEALTVQDGDVVWTLREEGGDLIAETPSVRPGLGPQSIRTRIDRMSLGPQLDLMWQVYGLMNGIGYACAWVEAPPTRTSSWGHVSGEFSLAVQRMVFRG